MDSLIHPKTNPAGDQGTSHVLHSGWICQRHTFSRKCAVIRWNHPKPKYEHVTYTRTFWTPLRGFWFIKVSPVFFHVPTNINLYIRFGGLPLFYLYLGMCHWQESPMYIGSAKTLFFKVLESLCLPENCVCLKCHKPRIVVCAINVKTLANIQERVLNDMIFYNASFIT